MTPLAEITSSEVPALLLKRLQDLHRFNQLREKQTKILVYIFAILAYLGVNLALFGLNFKSQEFIEEHYYLSFHVIEFWAVFVFTLIEAFVLLSTDTLTPNGPFIHRFQIGVAFFNILVTFIIAIIFSVDPQEYEVSAHYVEYSVQIPVTVVNFLFVINNPIFKTNFAYRSAEFFLASATFVASIFQLLNRKL